MIANSPGYGPSAETISGNCDERIDIKCISGKLSPFYSNKPFRTETDVGYANN